MSQVTETCACGASITYSHTPYSVVTKADVVAWRARHSQCSERKLKHDEPQTGAGDPGARARTFPGPEGQALDR